MYFSGPPGGPKNNSVSVCSSAMSTLEHSWILSSVLASVDYRAV